MHHIAGGSTHCWYYCLGVKGGLCSDAVQEVQPGAGKDFASKDSRTNSSCLAKQRLKFSAFLTKNFPYSHNVLECPVQEKRAASQEFMAPSWVLDRLF